MNFACLPQKAELNFLIPAIRKELAKLMSKTLSESEIAMRLGVTKPAVSQYINKKRGTEITLPADLKEEIKNSAKKIEKGETTSMQEISKILEISKETRFTCKVCHERCK